MIKKIVQSLRVLRLKWFYSKSPDLFFEKRVGHYKIKIAQTKDEIFKALELRHTVFLNEFSQKKDTSWFFSYDLDSHDFHCDHLIVVHEKSQKIVACYRLLASGHKDKKKPFYSEGEFEFSEFLNSPGEKLELGRACVHPDYRRGTVIVLLWRGLVQYAQLSGVRYLFGCSSIGHDQLSVLDQILEEIKAQDAFIKDWPVSVRPRFKGMPTLDSGNGSVKSLNSLMQIYLNAGAKVSREMAYDREMECLDLLTILDMKDLPSTFFGPERD